MLHVITHWPQAMSTHLWLYAMRMANDVMNAVPSRNDRKSTIQIFSGSNTAARFQQFSLLGCPVYVLQNSLQAGQQIPKWHKRARLGLYLGHSPTHARSVALVLNLSTGLVSPQFHVKFDEFFETVNKYDNEYPNQWKAVTHFEKENRTSDITAKTSDATLNNHMLANIRTEPPEDTPATPRGLDFTEETLTEYPTGKITPGTNSENNQQVKWSQWHAPSQHLRKSIEQGLLGLQCTFNDYEGHEEYLIQREMSQPIAFAANKSDPDTMYMHQAMHQPDKEQF